MIFLVGYIVGWFMERRQRRADFKLWELETKIELGEDYPGFRG